MSGLTVTCWVAVVSTEYFSAAWLPLLSSTKSKVNQNASSEAELLDLTSIPQVKSIFKKKSVSFGDGDSIVMLSP